MAGRKGEAVPGGSARVESPGGKRTALGEGRGARREDPRGPPWDSRRPLKRAGSWALGPSPRKKPVPGGAHACCLV